MFFDIAGLYDAVTIDESVLIEQTLATYIHRQSIRRVEGRI